MSTNEPGGGAASEPSQMLELLEANHSFPGFFSLSILCHNKPGVPDAVRAALNDVLSVPVDDAFWKTQESKKANYVSHRVTVTCDSAQHVLDVYERLNGVEGVIRVL